MNVVKLCKRLITNRNNYEQYFVTIPTPVAKHIKHCEQMNIVYNEERGIVECIPILEDKQ